MAMINRQMIRKDEKKECYGAAFGEKGHKSRDRAGLLMKD